MNDLYSLNQSVAKQIYDSGFVEPLSHKPVLVVTDDFKPFSYEWFDLDVLDTHLVYSDSAGYLEGKYFEYFLCNKTCGLDSTGRILTSADDAFDLSEKYVGDCVVEEELRSDELFIKTDCIGRPLLVKIPFHPNWHVEGAEKIYLASPALMVIVPERQSVHMYYGYTLPDYLGLLLSAIGLMVLSYFVFSRLGLIPKKIHNLFSSWVNWKIYDKKLQRIHRKTSRKIMSIPTWIMNNKIIFIAIILLTIAGLLLLNFIVSYKHCDNSCIAQGFDSSSIMLPGRSTWKIVFGNNNNNSMEEHDSVVKGLARDEFIYIQDGSVEFTIQAGTPGEGTLTFEVFDNRKRCGKIYVNKKYLGDIKSTGFNMGWTTFNLNLPSSYLTGKSESVKITHEQSDCFGWDIKSIIYTKKPCSCETN